MIVRRLVTLEDLEPDMIKLRIPLIATNVGNVDISSTGVKWASPKVQIDAKHLKALTLRASVSSLPSDAVVRIELVDVDTNSVVAHLEFAGTTGEDETTITDVAILSGLNGHKIQVRVNVTQASATATTGTVDYIVVEGYFTVK